MFQLDYIVRVLKQIFTIDKNEKNWVEELFAATECASRDPFLSCVSKTMLDKPIQGTFYAQEHQKVQSKEIRPKRF